ncbi:HWE histidine kinase domain-containing protein [Marinicaulis aureus]|uniref:histidine kinase n=1 Tax=Hyphococcus aureus TaxID=2666033 RepID=A0ABW1KZ63_9PROT
MSDHNDFQVDLTNCDREPIHQLGAIQQFGFLLAVSPDWIVTHASRNIQDFLGVAFDVAIGTALSSLLTDKAIHQIRNSLGDLKTPDSVQRLRAIKLSDKAGDYDVAVHRSGENTVIIEAEPADDSAAHRIAQIRAMADAVKFSDTIENASMAAAAELRRYLEFDRVMVYRFDPDGHGAVIAESARADLESYLGLNYPASDIPRQARTLYCRNLLRIISDVNAEPVPISPPQDSQNEPLDLSLSLLRSVSPIHIEYLKNIGVGASLSISILQDGKLWGLFACHHMSAKVLPQNVRTGAELFGELFSAVLSQRTAEVQRAHHQKARAIHTKLMQQFAGEASLASNFHEVSQSFQEVIAHDGAAAVIGDEILTVGETPTEDDIQRLAQFLNAAAPARIFATDRLGKTHGPGKDFAATAAGVLALPVSRDPRDYIILFRKELVRTVNWAGNPAKPAELGPNGVRLTPRKSFELWREEVRGQSAPWTSGELDAADAMRITLLEVVLRLTEAAREDREKAEQQQTLLIAELNHRVRNILNLIKGLVNQSRDQSASVETFADIVGARIESLAMAHDQITKENWNPASLYKLIETEASAYLSDKETRVRISGPDAMLYPAAFTTMALVIHELITNSAKHGALSDRKGEVLVALEERADGLQINWREQNGPKVKKPTRRGFGSTIIERTVPYDLKGEARINYAPDGVKASFTLPLNYVAAFTAPSPKTPPPQAGPAPGNFIKGRALIVEDNVIVAMEAESILTELGAKEVILASTVKAALAAIDKHDFDYAILDINLGDESALDIAKKLAAKVVPFIYTTGYGEDKLTAEGLPDAPVASKPYSADSLAKVLSEL